MREPSVRPAEAGDVAQLARVQLAGALVAFEHIFPASVPKPVHADLESEWRDLLADSRQRALVAEIGAALVGVVAFGRRESARFGTRCSLRKLYVDPDWWGKGIGSILHDRAVAGLQTMGCIEADLWVLERNLPARRMYEARGWKLRPWTQSGWPGTGILELCYSLELPTRL